MTIARSVTCHSERSLKTL